MRMRNGKRFFRVGQGRILWKHLRVLSLFGVTFMVFHAPGVGIAENSWKEESVYAPDFTLPNMYGKSVRLDEYKGQVVLLNFWATWCKDCAKEMPEFEKLYQAYEEDGLSVLAIALDKEGRLAVEAFLKKRNLKLTFPILLDSDGRIARAYRLAWVPVTIVVGRGGEIIETILGARPWGSKEVMGTFEHLLNAPAGN